MIFDWKQSDGFGMSCWCSVSDLDLWPRQDGDFRLTFEWVQQKDHSVVTENHPFTQIFISLFSFVEVDGNSIHVGTTKEQAASSNDNDPFICILPLPFSPILCVLQSFWRRRSCSSFNQNQHKTCERGKRILRFTGKPERCAVLDALHLLVPTKTY